jgi:hypothetical protein
VLVDGRNTMTYEQNLGHLQNRINLGVELLTRRTDSRDIDVLEIKKINDINEKAVNDFSEKIGIHIDRVFDSFIESFTPERAADVIKKSTLYPHILHTWVGKTLGEKVDPNHFQFDVRCFKRIWQWVRENPRTVMITNFAHPLYLYKVHLHASMHTDGHHQSRRAVRIIIDKPKKNAVSCCVIM